MKCLMSQNYESDFIKTSEYSPNNINSLYILYLSLLFLDISKLNYIYFTYIDDYLIKFLNKRRL